MTEKIASQLHEAYNNKGRTAKHLIPQGRIPDLGWNTDQQGMERQNLPNITPEAPVTQTTPKQVEGPPSSWLHSKTKIIMQGANYARYQLCKLLFTLKYMVRRCFASGVRGVLWGMFVRGCARRDLC